MPFFFKTANASVPYRAGDYKFTFEPVEVIAGSWRGVLEVATDKEAEALRSIGGPVSEVTAEQYADLKKKWYPHSRTLTQSSKPLPQTLHEVASSVEQQDSPEASSSTDTEEAPVLQDTEAAEVKLGSAEPPDDLSGKDTPSKKARSKK